MSTRFPLAPLIRALAALLTIGGLAGCTALASYAYDVNVLDARRQCERMPPGNGQIDCLRRLDDASRQASSTRDAFDAKTGPSKDIAASSRAERKDSLCFRRAATGEWVCPN